MFYVSGSNPAYTMAVCLAKGWAVRATCLNAECPGRSAASPYVVTWGEAELRARPPELTLGEVADRAVCSKCGGRHGHISTINGGWLPSPI